MPEFSTNGDAAWQQLMDWYRRERQRLAVEGDYSPNLLHYELREIASKKTPQD